jgi:pimeloyl-ACP methyl ester carboxylesterase
LVGNSGGGYLTLNTALYLPERVKKVVLISPAATFAQIWALYWHHLIPLAFIAPVIRSDRLVRKAYEWIWQGFPMDECYAQLHAIAQTAGYPRYSVTRNRGVRVAPVVFSDEELRKIRNPALLLIGDHEVIYKPERVIQRATRLVADLKAEIIPNANHVAEYTAPDVVNEKILKFFGDS